MLGDANEPGQAKCTGRTGEIDAAINLRSVIELMEATLAPVNCDNPVCIIEKNRTLKNILFEGQRKFLEHVGHYTLADLAEPKVSIFSLLSPRSRG